MYQEIAIVIVLVLAMWHLCLLPPSIEQQITDMMPKSLKSMACKCSPHTAQAVAATPAAVPKAACESFKTNTECGMYPSACDFFENKCRSRPLTSSESK